MKRIYILIVSLLSLIYSNSFSIKHKTENYSIKAKKAHQLIGNITVATFSLAFLTTLVP